MRYGIVSKAAPVRGGGASKGVENTSGNATGVPLYLNAPSAPELPKQETPSSAAPSSPESPFNFFLVRPQAAVASGTTSTDLVAPAAAGSPSDINLGFNALDASHRLIESIDQSQIKVEDDPYDSSRLFKRKRIVRHVDFPAVLAVLNHLTADQIKEVEAEYLAYEERPLQRDLFGLGESGAETDLTVDQYHRLKALLEGTRASSEDDAAAAVKHEREGDVAELHALLHGDLGPVEVERVMTLLRRSAEDVTALLNEYDLNYDLHADLLLLGTTTAIRAMLLLSGSSMAADAYAISMARNRIIAIDDVLKELQPTELNATTALVLLGEAASPGAAVMRRHQIDVLTAERKAQVQFIEERVQLVAGEARKEAEGEGQDAFAADTTIRTRVSSILGADGATEAVVGGTSGKLIHAVAANEPAEIVAAQLRKLDEAGKLTPEAMAEAFRGLRAQAAQEAQQRYPDATAEELKEEERKLSDQWFIHLRTTWDANVVNDGSTFDEVLDRGDQTEVDLKRGLYMASGHLSDADELVLALAGDRKDLDIAKRVLRDKNAAQIADLRQQYQLKTKRLPDFPLGRSLDFDLFGYAPTRVGEQNPIDINGNKILPQGKADGTDRLLLEDYTQRPAQEGGVEEVNYISGRAEREYEYTIDNRGATGWWRDHWGNEARSLLDATIKEVRQLWVMYMTLTRSGADIAAVKSAQAHDIIHKMHLARATIRGDRAGYEKATAALRATFQAIASFVLQAVLTAVLMPFATALFAARLAQAGATVVRFAVWTKNAAVGIAATIAANKAVYGNDYSVDMLKHDLIGGLGNVIGATGAGKLLGPVASRLTDRLGTTMGNEVIAGVKTIAGMETTAAIEGEDANVFENFLEQHFLGKVSETITHGTTKALGLSPAGPRAGVVNTETDTASPRPVETDVTDAPETHTPMKLDEGHTPMALPEPNKPQHEEQRLDAKPPPKVETPQPTVENKPAPEMTPNDEAVDTTGPDVEPESPQPVSGEGGSGGGGSGPGGSGGDRRPPGPIDPAESGIPASSSDSLQLAADQLDIVIKARPVNVHSAGHMGGEVPMDRRALPKMELVKAKTVNDVDLLIGAPEDSRGLVALFKPVPPNSALPSSTKRRAWRRYFQRLAEYHDLRAEYKSLEAQGIVHIENGLLKVADPRMAGGPNEPHGKFRPVAGDIDIFDITHSDGTPLQPHERTEVIRILRSMGIGIEHGAHVWWEQQSPETYDAEMDRRIRAEHTNVDQLVAFAPGTPPQGVWADTPVHGAPRQPGQRAHPPLRSMSIEGSDITAPGPDGDGGYIEITESPADLDNGVPGGPGRPPGSGGGGSGPGPQEPPGRPAHFAPWRTIDARLQAVQMPMRGRAVVAAYLLLERNPEWLLLQGRSGIAGGQGMPRTELTQPPRHIVAPRATGTYGPDAEVDPHHSGPRAHDAEANLIEQVAAQLLPGDKGELHIRTNYPTCPSCIEAFYRFAAEHPGILIVSHTASTTLTTPPP